MPSPMAERIIEVSHQLKTVLTSLEAQARLMQDAQLRYDDLLQRVAGLERDRVWVGDERRKLDKRLGSGDHTFKRIEAKAGAAWDLAEEALRISQNLDEIVKALPQKETGFKRIKKDLKKRALEAIVPIALGLAWWAVYHLFLIGPEIAKLMKAMKEGGH